MCLRIAADDKQRKCEVKQDALSCSSKYGSSLRTIRLSRTDRAQPEAVHCGLLPSRVNRRMTNRSPSTRKRASNERLIRCAFHQGATCKFLQCEPQPMYAGEFNSDTMGMRVRNSPLFSRSSQLRVHCVSFPSQCLGEITPWRQS